MAEGIAGSLCETQNPESGRERSFLMSLYEGGLQNVKVTKVFKKNVDLMFVAEGSRDRYLDDVVCPPAPHNTTVKWAVRYLARKEKEA